MMAYLHVFLLLIVYDFTSAYPLGIEFLVVKRGKERDMKWGKQSVDSS